MSRGQDWVRAVAALPVGERWREILTLPPEHRAAVLRDFAVWAEPGQLPPHDDWAVWLMRAGRGFGKTRAGAEWVVQVARGDPEARIALVGGTMADVERVMIGGESGLLACARSADGAVWKRSEQAVHFASGAVAYGYSAEAPEGLRGPQHHAAWCDELGKWRNGDVAWDNLVMGMRLGERPRLVVTTTPRPTVLMRRVMALPQLVETHGTTRDNPYLPDSYRAMMEASYAGTRLGRQELDGEMVEEVEGALWSRALLDRQRVQGMPELVRVVVGVDPPAGIGGDACGIVAVGLGRDGHGYVLADASVLGASPDGWARAVAACAERVGADRVVAEANQGGAMVESVLRACEATLPVKLVHARHGKAARAEPVAALFEAGRAFHVGALDALEDELCGLLAAGGYAGPGRSPDRADAMVWAMTEVMLRGRAGVPGVRVV